RRSPQRAWRCLGGHGSDPFNRWQAVEDVGLALAVAAVNGQAWSDSDVAALSEAMAETLASPNLDDAFKALALTLPGESQIARAIGKDVDPDRIHTLRDDLTAAVFGPLADTMRAAHHGLDSDAPYTPDPAGNGRRALRNRLLALLVGSGADG